MKISGGAQPPPQVANFKILKIATYCAATTLNCNDKKII